VISKIASKATLRHLGRKRPRGMMWQRHWLPALSDEQMLERKQAAKRA